MRELRVVRSVSGAVVVAADDGEEYRLPVTQALRAQLRSAGEATAEVEHKAPPREIQAMVRAGRTTEEIVRLTGASADQVRRFEGPVLAERAFVLESARGVPVTVADATLSDSTGGTFGAVIDARLDAAEARDRAWSSAKDPEHGWTVRVSYSAQGTDRESSWRFDPKKLVLTPHAGDAHVLSQHSVEPGPLVPRLRAVGDQAGAEQSGGRDDEARSTGRFDSGAFQLGPVPEDDARVDRLLPERPRPDVRSPASLAAVNRDPAPVASSGDQTADLLEALRRRRGEREAARFLDDGDARTAHPATGSIRIVDVPLGELRPEADPSTEDEPEARTAPAAEAPARPERGRRGREEAPRPTSATPRRRSGRASMPRW